MENKITKQETNFAKWYQDVCEQANLITYAPIKGTIIFEPYSFAIWELIQKELNIEFKKEGTQNVSLPLLIPMSFLEKEKNHIEGFAPELFTVTKIGDKELSEPYVIRPTSETLFAYYFKHRIQSYKQLPMILNQWCSVLRSENNTKPFLRTSEFLWQEGHTSHSNAKEAKSLSKTIWTIYDKFIQDKLRIATVKGKKTETEKFAGADTTYSIETMMKDGQALQSCTSHYLGQNFAKSFNVQFQGDNNKKEFVYQTSWGISTRIIGALIMNHGDNNGLVLPTSIAPYQVVVMELFAKKNPEVAKIAKNIQNTLNHTIRTHLDTSNKSLGFKSQEWETKGVPVRIEVLPRELEDGNVILVNRVNHEKKKVDIKNILKETTNMLKEVDKLLFKNSSTLLKSQTIKVFDYNTFKKEIEKGKLIEVNFKWSKENEQKIKAETGATTRCIVTESLNEKCFLTNEKANMKVLFARAY